MRGTNRVAVVTGANQGIGKAVAQALLKEGYSVVFNGRREELLKKAIEEVPEYKKNALIVPGDISNPKLVSELFKATMDTFGRIDFLFNNAGIVLPPTPLEDIPFSDWEKILSINLTGAFLCTQEAFRIMKIQSPQGGRILNNGSVAAQTPRAKFSAYTVSKHALTGLTKATALEGRDFNIACGQIDIGNANSKFVDILTESEPTISVESVTKMIIQIANLPLEENVLFTTMLATKMPFVGRG